MHLKFPSIEAFRNVVFKVNRAFGSEPKPVLTFRGTPKLHGTNAGIVYRVSDGNLTYQSRDRELSREDDLFGFMGYMDDRRSAVYELIDQYLQVAEKEGFKQPTYVAIFGEWAGGSIQKTDIAVRSMEKIWAVVGVRLYYEDPYAVEESHALTSRWLPSIDNISDHANRIYHISEFGTRLLEIDFNRPQDFESALEVATLETESQCPIGDYFGIKGNGEGIVWECTTKGYTPNDWADKYPESSSYDLTFKTKGEKHEQSKKKEMDLVDPEYVEKVKAFIDYAVTEVRMQQALDKLTREVNQVLTPRILGSFIKWVYQDILKEEGDVAEANEIEEKDLGKPIAEKAKAWFFKQLAQSKANDD